jgi:hypothetical protein
MGDADGNLRVNNGDTNAVAARVPCAQCLDDRHDIDGNRRISASDMNRVNSKIPSPYVPIPSGHDGSCSP